MRAMLVETQVDGAKDGPLTVNLVFYMLPGEPLEALDPHAAIPAEVLETLAAWADKNRKSSDDHPAVPVPPRGGTRVPGRLGVWWARFRAPWS